MLRRIFRFVRCLILGHRQFVPLADYIGEYHLMLFRTVNQDKGLSSSMTIEACRWCGALYVAQHGKPVPMPAPNDATHYENVHNVDETSATTG